MKLLLVNLDWPGLVSKKTHKLHLSLPPLDLILLAGLARKNGIEAQIFDCFVEPRESVHARLSNFSREADWIIVATTPYHMWQCPNSDWEWLREAIKRFPPEKTVLTGLHASVFPETTLADTGVRAVVLREPESVIAQFFCTRRWEECAGVAYLDRGSVVKTPPAELLPMEQLVACDYPVDISRYSYFLLGRNTAVFEASRGCPWKCTFCDQEMYGWKYRKKPPGVFAEEVRRAIDSKPIRTAYFFDLEFTVGKRRSLELCQELIRAGIPKRLAWCCQTRADAVDEEVVEALKAAGCKLIHFGVESANPAALAATNKKISVEQIERGVRLVKRSGIQTAGFFMFGLPEEHPEEFSRTVEFARALNPTYASFHFAIPFPGTPLYERYIAERSLTPGVWPSAYFEGWPQAERAAFVSSAYKQFYLRPKRFEIREFLFRMQNLRQKLAYFRSV